jgi:hypothetical protein
VNEKAVADIGFEYDLKEQPRGVWLGKDKEAPPYGVVRLSKDRVLELKLNPYMQIHEPGGVTVLTRIKE